MPAGRPVLPLQVKLIQGTATKSRTNFDEPIPEPSFPRCPKHIVGEERREWKRIQREVGKLNIVRGPDRAAMESYCRFYAKWYQAGQALQQLQDKSPDNPIVGLLIKTPSGYAQINPLWHLMCRAHERMMAFWTEFGLTPASRSRIRVEKEHQSDAFEQYRQAVKQRHSGQRPPLKK